MCWIILKSLLMTANWDIEWATALNIHVGTDQGLQAGSLAKSLIPCTPQNYLLCKVVLTIRRENSHEALGPGLVQGIHSINDGENSSSSFVMVAALLEEVEVVVILVMMASDGETQEKNSVCGLRWSGQSSWRKTPRYWRAGHTWKNAVLRRRVKESKLD